MKIVDKIKAAMAEGRTFFSFEYFPPRTEEVRIFFLNHVAKRGAAADPPRLPLRPRLWAELQ